MTQRRTPGIEQLIERQAVRWTVQRRATAPTSAPAPTQSVAVSRLAFSAAEEVAARVAEALDFGLFGRNAVEVIEAEHGGAAALVADLDERVRGAIERLVGDLFHSHVATEDERVRRVAQVVATLGKRGAAVILGRGAAHMLGPEQALRVLVVAPFADRAARLAATRGLADDEARAVVARDDRERAEFVRRYFGLDQSDPTLYDMTVNTATLGVDGAAALVVDAFVRRFGSGRRTA